MSEWNEAIQQMLAKQEITMTDEPTGVEAVLRAALVAALEWYDRDGSVGAASEVFETVRAALATRAASPAADEDVNDGSGPYTCTACLSATWNDDDRCDSCREEALAASVPSPAPAPAHPDDAAVDRFAAAMKAKLAKKRAEGRGGWEDKDDCSNAFLSKLLREHIDKGDPVDVGNLAMMIHQRDERIGS